MKTLLLKAASQHRNFFPCGINLRSYTERINSLVQKLEHYAVLDGNGYVVSCGKQRWSNWFLLRGGQSRSLIKRNLIGDYLIETCFNGAVSALEGEQPCFWRVRLTNPPNASPRSDNFLGALKSTIDSKLSHNAETIREALKHDGPVEHELSFTGPEDALNHHRELIKAVRKHQMLHRKGTEKAEVLLAELGDWCAEKRGRQSELARAIGATPQAVNNWLNGRKKMTGEQVLNVIEFMAKRRRSRSGGLKLPRAKFG
jgi:Putative antitoxin of bacterial toxin-antitoxin system, YdaS/YdaT